MKLPLAVRRWLFAPILSACFCGHTAPAAPATAILPIPQEVEAQPGHFQFNPSVVIALPLEPTPHDLFLAQSLTAELAQRYGLALRTERLMALPPGPAIVIGTWENPLIQEAERKFPLRAAESRPGAEGYVLLIQPDILVVDGSDEAGAFYGLQSVRQLLAHAASALELPGLRIRDWPYKPLRGVKLYLPGRDNIAFFKRFISDFMALYKFNALFVEIEGGMRFDRHPEINAGWIDLYKDMEYTRRDRATGPNGEYQDSPNQDTADGCVLEKEEVADLVSWTRRQHINFVPEVPSLTHSYYLLNRHRELADPTEAGWEWPDAYAAADPRSHQLLFDVLDEVIAVTKPNMVHIGHDEWRAPLGTVAEATSDDRRRLYASDLIAIHDYLAAKGIRTAIYGDHLLENVRGRGSDPHKTRTGHPYAWPGALTPGQVEAEIPKDILIFNWFWREGKEGSGEANDIQIDRWGFQQVFNNFQADITHYDRRSARRSIIGGVPSSWAATTEFNFGKDLIFDFIGCANLVWSTHWPALAELTDRVQDELPVVRQRLSGHFLPSEDGDPVEPIALPPRAGPAPDPGWGLDAANLQTGPISAGPLRFDLSDPAAAGGRYAFVAPVSGKGVSAVPSVPAAIPIGADVSSLIFLHALARPAANEFAYHYVYNFDDSADLMGCYEVVYEDGLIATIPIRYGVNILEWSWGRHDQPDSYPLPMPLSYGARAVEVGKPGGPRLTFFALEWPNPRLGKKIKEVRLLGSVGFSSAARTGKGSANNAILLRALSVVRPRAFPGADRAQAAPDAP